MLQAVIAGAGLATAAVGLFKGQKASKQAEAAQARITQASIQAERLRFKQMTLETRRRQRDIIRQSMIARSTAVSGASASGAMQSSGLLGGLGQISSQTGAALTSQGENFQIGEGLFQANVDKMNAEMSLAKARGSQATASGLFSLGSSLVSNAGGISSGVASARSSLFSGT